MEIDLEKNQEQISDFIDQIQAQNFNQAKDHFESVLSDKMSTALDQERINVADTIFNGAEDEEAFEDPEMEEDQDDDIEILDQEGEVIPDEDED